MKTYIAKSIYSCEYCEIALEISSEGNTREDAEKNVILNVILNVKFFKKHHENSQQHKEILNESNVYIEEIVAYING